MTHDEERYYDALKEITKFLPVEQLRKRSEKLYGLPFEEALEGAYENIIETAKHAVGRRKRPSGGDPC